MSNLHPSTSSHRALSTASSGGGLPRPLVSASGAYAAAASGRGLTGCPAGFATSMGLSNLLGSPAPIPLNQGIGDFDDRLRWLKVGVCVVLVLNVVDAIFTLTWVQAGLATEANPLLAPVVGIPLVFMAVKLAAVSLGAAVFWRHLARPISTVAVCVANTAYAAVCLYHLAFLAELVI